MTHSGACLLFLSATACVGLLPPTGFAQDAGTEGRRIRAAIMLDGLAEPVLGEARCRIGTACGIIAQSKPRISVDVYLRGQAKLESVEMTIECPKDCSFASWKPHINLQGKRKFDIFSGVDGRHVETLLVLIPRTKIGEIFLIVE